MQREVTIVDKTEVTFVIEGTGVISGFLLDPTNKLPLPIIDEIKVEHIPNEDEIYQGIYTGKVTDGYFEVRNLLPGSYRIIDSFNGYVLAKTDLPKFTVYPRGSGRRCGNTYQKRSNCQWTLNWRRGRKTATKSNCQCPIGT